MIEFLALFAAAAIPKVIAECPWQRARYEMVGDPNFTVVLVALPRPRGQFIGDLAFRIRAVTTGHSLWFVPGEGSSGIVTLSSIDDPTRSGWKAPNVDGRQGRPHADVELGAYDRHLKIAEGLATSDEPAAAYLSMPAIADMMLHAFDHADQMSNTMFQLSRCAPK